MAKKDWRSPFLALKDQLLAVYDSNPRLYHGVMMAFRHERRELKEVVNSLEPAFNAKQLVHEVSLPTPGCSYHGHFYFGEDNIPVHQLQRHLSGCREWIAAIPKELLPPLQPPRLTSQADADLTLWTELVYQLAFLAEAPYFTAVAEFQEQAGATTFFLWHECPQPAGCDPVPWLLRPLESEQDIIDCEDSFRIEGFRLPDIIGAYLEQEFILSSIAAVDVLVFMLEGLKEKALRTKKTKRRRRGEAGKKAEEEAAQLVLKIGLEHKKRREQGIDDRPLKAEEMAELMGWYSGNGTPSQYKVSRRLKKHFGTDPMQAYKEAFEDDSLRDLLFETLKHQDVNLIADHREQSPDAWIDSEDR